MMYPTIELTRIRETYRYMGDEELLSFAGTEGLKLTMDAYLLLKEELQERNIGAAVIKKLEQAIILQYSLQRKKFEEDLHKDLFSSSLEYALSEKYKGASRYTIYAGLVERGITDDYASYMVNKLDEWALRLQEQAAADMQTGVGIFLLGIIILCITVSIQRFEIAAAMIIITGLARLLLSWKNKNQYKRIVEALAEESLS